MIRRFGRFLASSSYPPTGRRPRGRREPPTARNEPQDRPENEHKASRRASERRLRSLLSVRSVAGQMFVLHLAIVVLLGAAAAVLLVLQSRRDATQEARQRTSSVAQGFANAPGTVEALDSADPTAVLQPRAEAARKQSGVAFVVVYRPDGIRLTHPDPALIGKHVIGPYKEAASGRAFTKVIAASRGPAVNSLVPVFRDDGSVAGVVDVAVTVQNVNADANRQLPVLFGAAAGALALAMGGSALMSRRLRRQTHGLAPVEMTRMYEHHDAVLHAVREGVLIVGGKGRLLLANDEARELLDLPGNAEGRHVGDLGLDEGIAELLASGRAATDEVHLAGDRLLAVNNRPTAPYGGPVGSVATLRDTTELRALSGRAEVARERLKLLHDAGVRIGTTLDVGRTAQELAKVAVPRFADFVTVDLADAVLRGEEPAGPGIEMRRTAVSGIREDPPLSPVGALIRGVSATPEAWGVAGGRAVLEADLHAARGWRAQDPQRTAEILDYGMHSLVTVPLRARGTALGKVDFWRSETPEPFEDDDLALAEELVARAAVCVDNARRYTREHTLAVTLQRSLLPRGLPEQSAVEAAYRYLPAQAGVGGDWFDVIPLPGARVALVVGDVVGHGLHAAATMGRLRTAVHNFSTLDLPPDELLSHLDELVAHIDTEDTEDTDNATAEGDGAGVTGATCLYAIYDPVTGRCTLARAGHLGPALIRPDGTVAFPSTPVSPPLGLGGSLPVETAELQLPAGSRLALYTDGLVEDRDRDLDQGLALLQQTLAGHPGRTPEETCQAVFDALRPARPRDDIALLVARTRLLDPGQVADWEVPSDPAAVAPVRAACVRQVEAWGLAEIGFTTGLILSELITNAVRYGTPPIRVRLLYDRALICEVADGSSTSPHLRRAKTTDEGGRGLFLVAQFAQRWGTRYTADGKVIWTEQSLHNGEVPSGGAMVDSLLDQWDDPAL